METTEVAATLAFFAVGTFWFWVLAISIPVLLFLLVELEWPGWATASVLATILLLEFLGDANIFVFIRDNPILIVVSVFAYFCAGTVWSYFKWWFYARKKRHEYDEAMEYYGRYNDNVLKPKVEDYKPRALDHKRRILIWMSYWPWSMVWTLINDFVKDIFEFIFHRLHDAYQKVSDDAFRGVEE